VRSAPTGQSLLLVPGARPYVTALISRTCDASRTPYRITCPRRATTEAHNISVLRRPIGAVNGVPTHVWWPKTTDREEVTDQILYRPQEGLVSGGFCHLVVDQLRRSWLPVIKSWP